MAPLKKRVGGKVSGVVTGLLKELLKDDKGSITVLYALSVVVLLGFVAFTLDVGKMYSARGRLSGIADAAALAGAQLLPLDPGQAVQVAYDIAQANGVPPERVEVRVQENNRLLEVDLQGIEAMAFGSLIGTGSTEVAVRAAARNGVAAGIKGAVPLGIDDPGESGFVEGQPYTFKLAPPGQGGTGGEKGNFHALALGGEGAAVYRENLKYGYPSYLRAGQVISTEPGNMHGPTEDGVRYRIQQDPHATYTNFRSGSPRVVYVPVVSFEGVQGRDEVAVLGFAAFFLEDYVPGEGEVRGRFLSKVVDAEMDDSNTWPDLGLRTVRLVR